MILPSPKAPWSDAAFLRTVHIAPMEDGTTEMLRAEPRARGKGRASGRGSNQSPCDGAAAVLSAISAFACSHSFGSGRRREEAAADRARRPHLRGCCRLGRRATGPMDGGLRGHIPERHDLFHRHYVGRPIFLFESGEVIKNGKEKEAAHTADAYR